MAKDLNNLTVITKISTSKSLTSSLNYTNSDKPHNSDHGRIKHRDLKSWGINCSDDPQLARLQMTKTLWEAHAHRVHDIREIKSFNDVLDYRNPHDRKIAIKLNTAMMKAEHPNCQIFCQLQVDGKTHHVHIHNHVCPRQFTDLKSITANQMSIRYYIKPIDDKIMKAHHFNTLRYHQSKSYRQHISNGERYYSNRGKSWVKAIRNRLNLARNYATSDKSYVTILKDLHVNIEWLKMHTVNGKREIHFYKNKSKSPKVLQLKIQMGRHKGEYVRPRKHFSYDFKFNGHKYKIRDKALGSDFFVSNLMKQFRINKANYRNITLDKMIDNNPKKLMYLIWHQKPASHPKSLAHQQSDGIQPVLNRAKNNVSGKKDINSIEHKPKNTSVVRANKLMKYVNWNGKDIIPSYTRTIGGKLKGMGGNTISFTRHMPSLTFHMPMIKLPKLPHKPSIPLLQFMNHTDNDTQRAMEANINADEMDRYRQKYDDYLIAKQGYDYAKSDSNAKARQEASDINKEIRAEREAKARHGMSR